MSQILTPPSLRDTVRWRGKRIGLLGGSFNPPHHGHYHIAKLAMIQFGLDFVWWIVTPQNPFKDKKGIAPYTQRFSQVEAMTNYHPRMMTTHLESELGTDYTYQTVTALKHHFPTTDFLWICGMDNALIFHRWDQWRALLDTIPITFIARPPAGHLVKSCPLKLYKRKIPHYYKTCGTQTNLKKPGIYWLSQTKMVDISSTEIRLKTKA